MRSRSFRRAAICVCGVLLSSYFVLFVVVVSKKVDKSAEDKLRRSISSEDTTRRRVVRRIQVCTLPGYRDPPGPVTALASFPGSGNTWIRFLVQQATGILTGSVYNDFSLKRNGFPGEGTCNGAVLLVKTHGFGAKERSPFEKAVLLVRDPYGALLAEFNRRSAGHIGHAAANKFFSGNSWRAFAFNHARAWMLSILDWLQFDGPLHILRYEDIATDLTSHLLRLLRFLHHKPLSDKRLQCVLRNRDGLFRRPKRPLSFEPFNEEMRRTIDAYKMVVEEAIAKFELNATMMSTMLYNETVPENSS